MEDQSPLVIDDATQLRDYERSTLYYPSVATQAGSTRYPLAARDDAGLVERGVVEPALFVVNTAVLPFTYLVWPPGTTVDWHASVTEPSYTVQPAYPPEVPAGLDETDEGQTSAAPTAAGPVPPTDAPVPSPAEPVRDPSGGPSNLPTGNEGPGSPGDGQ